jgi:hypothetical protein
MKEETAHRVRAGVVGAPVTLVVFPIPTEKKGDGSKPGPTGTL